MASVPFAANVMLPVAAPRLTVRGDGEDPVEHGDATRERIVAGKDQRMAARLGDRATFGDGAGKRDRAERLVTAQSRLPPEDAAVT